MPRAHDASGKDLSPRRRFTRDLPSPFGPHPAEGLLTPERRSAFRQVLARRCKRLAVILEDCHDPHNATAVIRTLDCFGMHRLAVSTSRTTFKINRRISQGSHHHLDLRVFADIQAAIASHRAEGYRVLVSDLAADAVAGPQELAAALAAQPLALVFGSEGFGVTEAARQAADGCFLIPMTGFTQSLNLSVSVAVSVYALRGPALSADQPGDLTAEEQAFWFDTWVQRDRGEMAARLKAQDPAWLPPPDPRSTLATGKRGEELEVFGAGG